MSYQKYLKQKLETFVPCGIECTTDQIHSSLFDFQKAIVCWAARMGRAAIFADCGLGKTRKQIEWARIVSGKNGTSLIYAPLTVAEQTIDEGKAIGVPIRYVESSADINQPGIYITNYERCHKFAALPLTAVVLDESSILKNFNGATRNALIQQYQATPYRLACTATPAPNDITEIANHSEFLGVKSRVELLSTYFVHDQDGWRLKGHAINEFYKWLASWSVYLRTPEDVGFDGSKYILPPLNLHDHVVNAEVVPDGHLFPVEVTKGVVGRSELRKLTMEDRVKKVVELVNSSKEQWLVWVGLNDESALIQNALPEAVTVEGSDSMESRLSALRAFKSGQSRVLISKPKVSGFGINFQHCRNMVFCGLSDSWEQYYQAIRRCWRFGQERPVEVHIVSSSSEARIVENVKNKEEQAKFMGDQIIKNVGELNKKNNLNNAPKELGKALKNVSYGKNWTLWNGDCVEVLRDQVKENEVDFSVYSPPFATLYTYSDDIRDLGNCKDHSEFFAGYKYVCQEILRVTKPGRITAVHVQQLTTRKGVDGFIGLTDFRGAVIETYKQAGWQHFGEVCIDKCPQAQAIRTKAHSLMFVTKNKDRSKIRPALSDFILLFKKPGENEVPIQSDEVSNEDWIEWARPIWYGIKESDTLNTRVAKTEKDERHICPLQLGVIERCIKLWSNPGDLVLSPFAGIGSEGHEAIKAGRKFVGVELKPEYWEQAKKNIDAAVFTTDQELSLFEDLEFEEIGA